MRRGFLAVLVLLLTGVSQAAALDNVPEKPGWHGFVLLGVGSQSVESNFIVGSSMKELGDAEIDSVFDDAERVSDGIPVLNGELGYRFKGSQTYLSAGNSIEDVIRYDFTGHLALRQGMGGAGLLSVEFLFSASPGRVWEDPYLTGDDRDATDRNSQGGRITWGRIGGSGLEVELTARKIDIDEEHSGEFLALSAADRRLIERDGGMGMVRVAYRFKLGERHHLVPRVTFQRHDLDGEAVAYDASAFEVAWLYLGEKAVTTVTLYAEATSYDDEHPIYGEKTDSDGVGLSLVALFPSWLPGKWSAGVTGAYYKEDSDVDFFDASVTSIALVSSRRW